MTDVSKLSPVANEMLSGLSADEALKRRILFQAQALPSLPQTASEMLGGLQKTPALRHRILVRAAHKRSPRTASYGTRRLSPVMSIAMVAVVMLSIGLLYGNPSLFGPNTGVDPAAVITPDYTINTNAAGGEIGPGALTPDKGVPKYSSLFASTADGAQALISVNGRYYQMMTSPVSMDAKLLGNQLGDIQQRITDFSSVGEVGIYSNIVGAGDAFYSVAGFSDQTMIAAPINGATRLFQRVAYGTNALVGSETLADTLAVQGEVTMLELSGVGIVSDPSKANSLLEMLLDEAIQSGTSIPSGNQVLTIYLKNKLSLQLNVSGDFLSACGAWACPDFLEAFQEAVSGN